MKKTYLRGVFFLFIFFFSPHTYAKNIVIVGIYNNKPLSYIDTNGEAKGLFPSILNDIAKENNLQLHYKKCIWSKCLKMLANGKIDILGPIAYSKSRTKKFIFSKENILANWGTLYTNQNTNVISWENLKNKTVGLQKGDIYAEKFMDYITNLNISVKIVYFDTYKEIFTALNKNSIDIGVSNSTIFPNLHDNFPSIKKTNIMFSPVNITFAYSKKKKDLRNLIDKNLKNYKIDINSKFYKELHKYLDIKPEYHYKEILFAVIFALVLLGILLLLINRYLKKLVAKATKKYIEAKNIANEKYQNELYLNKIITTVKNVNQLLIKDLNIKDKLTLVCNEIIKEELYESCWIGFAHADKIDIFTHSKNFDKYIIIDSNILTIHKTQEENSSIVKAYIENKTCTKAIRYKKSLFHKANKPFEKKYTYILTTPICINNNNNPLGVLVVYTINEKGFKKKEISLIEELVGDISLSINIDNLKEQNEIFFQDKIKNYKEMVFSLNKAIEARDPYTAGHDSRVSEYATLIAKELNVSQSDIDCLQKASELHDIGKIETPDSILLKPGALNHIEYDIIKQHPKRGYEIISNISFLKKEAKIILYHHERYDGSGYPNGLKKDEIPLLSQILSIADTFDAMTTNRVYKPAKNKQQALKEIESLRNIWFSDKLIDATIKALKDYPINPNIYNNLPKNSIEEARFSYFFKDHMTECYNLEFLKHLYVTHEVMQYTFLYTLAIHNFTKFNRELSWENGDILLSAIAKLLSSFYGANKVFRVKGDDFIIISKKEINISKKLSKNLMGKKGIINLDIKKHLLKEYDTMNKLKELIRII